MLLICSCNGFEGKRALTHLTDQEFLNSNPKPEQFGDYELYERMNHYNVPGLSIAVVENGEIIWAEGFGQASLEQNKNVNTTTLFQAASISKPIAALAILKLSEQKLVDLDEDVNRYLKSYQIPENEFTKEKRVTLRAILSHTAGLNVQGFPGYNTNESMPGTSGVLKGEGNTEKVVVEAVPGSRWHYSGGGYTILQKVVEDVSGESFEAFMKDEVLDPLGMSNSTFVQPLPERYHSNASSAFDADGELLKGKWRNYPEKAAAGLWTTPTDLAKYCIAIQEILSGENRKGILKKETVEMMMEGHYNREPFYQSPNKPSGHSQYWGLGPEIAGEGRAMRFQHGGRNEGFKANFTAFVHKGQAIVLMANADNGYDLLMEVEKELSDYYAMGIWQ